MWINRKRITFALLGFSSVAMLVLLLRSQPRVGSNAEEALALLQSKWNLPGLPVEHADQKKYVPYRRFHLSYGGGSLDTDTTYYFPRGRARAIHWKEYFYGKDGTITNISSEWTFPK